jgi:hypothetical protein
MFTQISATPVLTVHLRIDLSRKPEGVVKLHRSLRPGKVRNRAWDFQARASGRLSLASFYATASSGAE